MVTRTEKRLLCNVLDGTLGLYFIVAIRHCFEINCDLETLLICLLAGDTETYQI